MGICDTQVDKCEAVQSKNTGGEEDLFIIYNIFSYSVYGYTISIYGMIGPDSTDSRWIELCFLFLKVGLYMTLCVMCIVAG